MKKEYICDHAGQVDACSECFASKAHEHHANIPAVFCDAVNEMSVCNPIELPTDPSEEVLA